MVTIVPTGPLVGEKPVIVGGTVNLFVLVAVPAGVVTLIGPVAAPVGTVARIEVAESTVKPALAPLNLTAVAPVNVVPVMVTDVPAGPLMGVKPAIAGTMLKSVALAPVPAGVATCIKPVVAPAGTAARIVVEETRV
jgi:hypothetical protein